MKYLDRTLVTSPVYYALCQNEKGFKKELKRLRIPKQDWPEFLFPHAHATVHYFCKNDEEIAIVCLGKTNKATSNQIVGLLIHEAVHIWQRSKEIIGEPNPSKEFEAYSIQCIAQELISAYKK